jgi:protein ImuA
MTEVLQLAPGRGGEWGLLAPALGLLGWSSTQARAALSPSAATVLVGAPYMPFGPALAARRVNPQQLLWVHADQPAARLWAAEQALRCADVQAVLAWLPRVNMPQLQRLHRAAQAYGKLLFVFRPQSAQQESSPAPLRLLLCHAMPPDNLANQQASAAPVTAPVTAPLLQVHVFKRRGPPLQTPVEICPVSAELQALLAASRVQSRRRRAASSVGPVPGTALKERAHALDRFAAAC